MFLWQKQIDLDPALKDYGYIQYLPESANIKARWNDKIEMPFMVPRLNSDEYWNAYMSVPGGLLLSRTVQFRAWSIQHWNRLVIDGPEKK